MLLTMDTSLPKRLKSGRRLVATAAGGRVGLYRLGDDDYAIMLPNGKLKRGITGSQGVYPTAPDGHWTWLRAKAHRRKERKEKRVATLRLTSARSDDDDDEPVELPVSPTQLCVDCDRDVRLRKHAHTARGDNGYGAATLCCRCARGRGAVCDIYEKGRKKRRRKA